MPGTYRDRGRTPRWCVWVALCYSGTLGLAFAAVDINHASALDLRAFKGIGPAMEKRILDARQQQPFQNWSDLQNRVKGMGGQKADALSAQGLTVNGLRYGEVGTPAARPWQPFQARPLLPQPPGAQKP